MDGWTCDAPSVYRYKKSKSPCRCDGCREENRLASRAFRSRPKGSKPISRIKSRPGGWRHLDMSTVFDCTPTMKDIRKARRL